MMNKLLVIGLVAVVIVAGFLFLFPNGESEEAEIIGDITVTVTEIGTDNEYEGTLSIVDPSWSEQMMFSVGQDIRETDLLDFTQNAGPLKGTSKYSIVVSSAISLTGSNIASISKNTVKVSGSLTYQGVSMKLLHAFDVGAQVYQADNALVLGQTKTITSTGFRYVTPTLAPITPFDLTGAHIVNGVTLKVQVDVDGIDYNGKAVTTSVSANLVLSASLVADGTLSASITSISSTTTPLSTLSMDALVNRMDLAKVEA